MTESSFESTPIADWSSKHTEEWLKWCLSNYQLEDPYLYTKIKLKGKTLQIYHKHREFNKFYAECDAEKLHEDLENRLNPNLKPKLKPLPNTPQPTPIRTNNDKKLSVSLWDKFEKQLEEINNDFGKILEGNQNMPTYPKEVIIEALYSLKCSSGGNSHIIPIECLVSRMANNFSKQAGFTFCGHTIQHFESGHIKLRVPIDDAVGFFVQKFYLHNYPALAAIMLEQIVYLGQLNAIKTNLKSDKYPAIVPISNMPRSRSQPEFKMPIEDEYDKFLDSKIRKGSTSSVGSLDDSDYGSGKPSLSTIDEELDDFRPKEEGPIYSRNRETIFVEGNHIVVDYTMDQVQESKKLTFDYDSNIMLKFEVNSQDEHPKTITNINKLFKIRIENTTARDIGFSLRAYNLSMPGNIKVLYPIMKSLHVLRSKQSEQNILEEHIWEQELELQIESARDYVIFELVVCSLSKDLKNNTWNIQRNFIHVNCKTESDVDDKTLIELQMLANKSMGVEKRKKCIQILLDSLYYYYANNDEEQAYWLATQLSLLPDFQRPQLLVPCWFIISNYVYRDVELDFSQQRPLIALINAGTDIKMKLETMNINTLKNIMRLTETSESVLREYLTQHKIRKSQSSPEIRRKSKESVIPLIIEEDSSHSSDSSPVSTPGQYNEYLKPPTITKALSEPILNLKMDEATEDVKFKTAPLKYRVTRKASETSETFTFEKCEIICPPCETNVEILFGYNIMNTIAAQVTLIPGILHLATLELSNEIDNGSYSKPYRIKFPLPNSVSENEIIRVVYHNGETGQDITEKHTQDFNPETHTGSILVPRNGIYIILGVEGYPSKVTNYVANEILCSRPLYTLLWMRNVKGYNDRKEIWCCLSCQKDKLLRPPHGELQVICRQLRTVAKLNAKIEISLQLAGQNEGPEMKYEFNLTDTQGIYNFVKVIQVGNGKQEGTFTVKSQNTVSEKIHLSTKVEAS